MFVFAQALPTAFVCFFYKKTNVVGRLLAADCKIMDYMFYFGSCNSSLLATGKNHLDAGIKLKLSVSSLAFECTQV